MTDRIKIGTSREVLTDRSEVFNVVISEGGRIALTLHAVSELDAHTLADALVELFGKHTVDEIWS